MRHLFIISVIAFGIPQVAGAEPRRPNVVFVLADDLGYTDLACYGSRYYETPNIDRLAAEGVRFTDGYTCGPNCQPTRAALLSGQYGPRTGVYTVGSIDRFNWRTRPLRPVDNVTALPLGTITIADSLKKAGYATGMFGKWHLGNDAAHHPSARGFDEAIATAGRHFNFQTDPPVEYPKSLSQNRRGLAHFAESAEQNVPVPLSADVSGIGSKRQYLADFLTDRAVDFIDRHRTRPFFLFLPHFAVHAPHQAKKKLINRFQDKPPADGHHDPTYAAMIVSVDESVGRILDKLDELKLAENTLVIFSSDNGGVGGYRRAGLANDGVTDNAPLKGGKGMLFEGGVRVPYIFRWKGTIAPGRIESTPIISVDLYPTLLELAGAEPPAGQPLDGASYAGLLTGKSESLERDAIYWHFPGYLGAGAGQWRTTPVGAVRAGDWKLLEYFEEGRLELYNLNTDVGEQHNLAAAESEKANELHAKLVAWRKSVGARMPTKNLAQDDSDWPRKKNQQRKRRGAA